MLYPSITPQLHSSHHPKPPSSHPTHPQPIPNPSPALAKAAGIACNVTFSGRCRCTSRCDQPLLGARPKWLCSACATRSPSPPKRERRKRCNLPTWDRMEFWELLGMGKSYVWQIYYMANGIPANMNNIAVGLPKWLPPGGIGWNPGNRCMLDMLYISSYHFNLFGFWTLGTTFNWSSCSLLTLLGVPQF